MDQHGDAKLTDLLRQLAACPKARSAGIHDRCKGSSTSRCREHFDAQKQKNGFGEQAATLALS
jgi:hypothetical protein